MRDILALASGLHALPLRRSSRGPQRRASAEDPIRRVLGALTVAMLAAGCAASPGSTASADRATLPAPTEAVSPAPTEAVSPASIETASPPPPLHLVAIGDSIAGATKCECPRFPEAYGKLAAEALGRPVWVKNLAIPGTNSADLLHAVRTSPQVESAIREADLIIVAIGINDIGRCGTVTDRACYEGAIAGVGTNLEALLGEVDTLQGDHPHILRQTAYYNASIGGPGAAQLDPSFGAFYAEQLEALNSTICAAVVAHHGLCVELLTAFNGPAGDQDAAPLLVDDHVHPSRAGHVAIAQEVAAAGYAPLRP
jgi:lysophospholipase L1-like esterase